jgi:paraquat-inducible protein A
MRINAIVNSNRQFSAPEPVLRQLGREGNLGCRQEKLDSHFRYLSNILRHSGGTLSEANTSAPGPIPQDWRECTHCGLVSTLPAMRPALVAECPRCNHTLWRMRPARFEFPIACGLAGLLFFTYATIAPFLEISAYGRFQLARIETGPVQLALGGFALVGSLVMAVTVIFPAAKLGIMLTVLIGLRLPLLAPRLLKFLFRWYAAVAPWAMIDVYLLGFLVAYTRLTAIASVHLDTALYALIGLMISMAAADGSLDTEAVWRALDNAERRPPPQAGTAAGLIGCHCCGLVNQAAAGTACRRCRTVLQRRKPDSINRAWAFVAAAVLLYVPANIYPVLLVTQLAVTQQYNIMGGIVELADYGLWPLAGLVFLASITIPLLKLLILAYMLVLTQLRSHRHLLGRTRAYRLVEFIGRWSMIDVFMISILVALVRFDQFANIRTDIGAPCFAGVVVLTIFAADCFDPRLMWDAAAAETAPQAATA